MQTAAFLVLSTVLICACASPAHRIDAVARNANFQKQVEWGSGFRHVIYRNAAATQTGVLHVYIEGDGTPYRRPDTAASDPTPRNPLMLRLMVLDPTRSIYLGRPCYFEPNRDRACDPIFWTLRRYGPEVLDSMAAVLRLEAERAGADRIELFGHSGGGTLAVLLSQRLNNVTRVITLGANLDTAAWCKLHHYTPLSGSENPADTQPQPNPGGIQILHLVGTDDTNTPPSLVIAAAHARGDEPVRVVAHFSHSCCWETTWADVLRE